LGRRRRGIRSKAPNVPRSRDRRYQEGWGEGVPILRRLESLGSFVSFHRALTKYNFGASQNARG